MATSECVHDNDGNPSHLEIKVTIPESLPSIPRLPQCQVVNSDLVCPPPSPASSTTIDTSPAPAGACDIDSNGTNHMNHHCDYTEVPIPKGHTDLLPNEWWKTGLAFLYTVLVGILTAVTLTAVHESMPEALLTQPLPDKVLDYVDEIPGALTVTEVVGLVLLLLWSIQWLSLKHKSIISRRFFFLLGTLYMYRCVTMYITTLPVPGKHIDCGPKLHNDTTAQVLRLFTLMAGGGMSVTGSHRMCGDYLYSGHTVMLSLLYLFIKEYSPPSMWLYHWLCWLASATGIIFILIGHEHYSIDIVIAYFFTTRLFWGYHEMANTHALQHGPYNYLSRTWWNPVFNFLERNVQTTVPLVFSWPFFLSPCCKQRYGMVEGGETNESESESTLSQRWFAGDGRGIVQRDETFSETVVKEVLSHSLLK